jgi:hypothetical protein
MFHHLSMSLGLFHDLPPISPYPGHGDARTRSPPSTSFLHQSAPEYGRFENDSSVGAASMGKLG